MRGRRLRRCPGGKVSTDEVSYVAQKSGLRKA